MSKKAIFCTVETEKEALSILSRLEDEGYSHEDISILFPENSASEATVEKNTKASEGALTGAGAGGILGGTLGWLAGISSLSIPGLGIFRAAGPIFSALSGAAIGATVGGVSGALVGLGIPKYEVKEYERKIKEGESFISVRAEDGEERERVKNIFEEADAHNISMST